MEEFFKRQKKSFLSKKKAPTAFRNSPLRRSLTQEKGSALFMVLITIAMNLVFLSSAMLAITHMFKDNKNVSEMLRLKRTAKRMALLLSSPIVCTQTVLAHADQKLSSTDDVEINYIKLGDTDAAFFTSANDEDHVQNILTKNHEANEEGSPLHGIETGYQPKKVKVFSIKFSTEEAVVKNKYQTLHGSLKIKLGKGENADENNALETREFVFKPFRMRVLGDNSDDTKGQIYSCMLLADDKNVFMLSCDPGMYLEGYTYDKENDKLTLNCIEGQSPD